jgi:hypothetical protein
MILGAWLGLQEFEEPGGFLLLAFLLAVHFREDVLITLCRY